MLRCAQHDKRVFTKRRHKPISNSPIPIKEFRLDLSELTYTGHDLVRPESILAKPNGTLWVSDGRGGVTRIDPDGQQTFLSGLGGEPNVLTTSHFTFTHIRVEYLWNGDRTICILEVFQDRYRRPGSRYSRPIEHVNISNFSVFSLKTDIQVSRL